MQKGNLKEIESLDGSEDYLNANQQLKTTLALYKVWLTIVGFFIFRKGKYRKKDSIICP
jgi:hypothetical protein